LAPIVGARMGSVKALRPTPGLGVGPKSTVCPGLLADWNPRTLDRAPAQTYVQSAARAGGRRWATTGGTGTRSGDGSTRRPRTDPVLVMLLVAITTELLAGLGFALGIQPAGSLGMITGSVLAVIASALVLRRQPRLAARRIFLGLLGCVGVSVLVLLVSSALNAAIVGAVLGPLCGIVVLVALMAERGHSGRYVLTWGFLGESRSDETKP
jgi:hypothetical protein